MKKETKQIIDLTKTTLESMSQILEWLDGSTAYLSTGADYAKGYKAGIEQAKEIIREFVRPVEELAVQIFNYENNETYN